MYNNDIDCLFCSLKKYGNYPFCKKHKNKRLTKIQYDNLESNIQENICGATLNNGKICCRNGRNKICNFHKRIKNGICYVKYCNNIASEKGHMCHFHRDIQYTPCLCCKHVCHKSYYDYNFFGIESNILKNISLPDDLIYYICSFNHYNFKPITMCLSKNFKKLVGNIFKLPYQINISEEFLVKKLHHYMSSVEECSDIQEQINFSTQLFSLLCENLYILKKYPKFHQTTINKLEECKELVPESLHFKNTINVGVTLI